MGRRKKPTNYDQLMEIAQTAHRHLIAGGRWRFREGVVEAAARSAIHAKNGDEVLMFMERAFRAYRTSINPRWDGSIA